MCGMHPTPHAVFWCSTQTCHSSTASLVVMKSMQHTVQGFNSQSWQEGLIWKPALTFGSSSQTSFFGATIIMKESRGTDLETGTYLWIQFT